MARRKKLTEAQWREVFRLRCKSKRGDELSKDERALLDAAFAQDEERYDALSPAVFNATVPFGSNARWGK